MTDDRCSSQSHVQIPRFAALHRQIGRPANGRTKASGAAKRSFALDQAGAHQHASVAAATMQHFSRIAA
jgi:hypothetical protein